ncbi:AAA family ATPase [Clostridium botulinum]|uniref:AAA family ATPase n=1 Tax=Clostridium botulinum TaxID=1491 RepID=UPI00067BE967|nr:AAA family ATPase [Clostridium botulinum]
MIIKSIEIEKFRAIENLNLRLGKNLTAIAGRNATLKSTLLGIIGQPFTISKDHPMYGCKTIDGYNFRSQFKEKFKISSKFDYKGEHIWKLNLYNNGYYKDNEITMKSIERPSKSNPNDIRFWNSKSKSKGSGYIQLPVYYLSLSRLFPIGESGKTKNVNINLTDEESKLFLKYYKKILSIHAISNKESVGMEKGASSRVFVGVNDDTHDIFTNSAGESNIGRIILAVLSFKRLKEKYNEYKGGILLVDEIDATLYGYSQKKLIDFLFKASKNYHIQIIFTTHSPLLLKQVNKYQREEVKNRKSDINRDDISYNSTIIYLQPKYTGVSKVIDGKNINSAAELNTSINDINLKATVVRQSINVYLEDIRAKDLLVYLLKEVSQINYENYINIIDINLGWSNYIQLHKKKVPEFLESIIILDNDVRQMKDAREANYYVQNKTNNIMYLPVDVEKGIFDLLKDYTKYSEFEKNLDNVSMNYDICFRDWTEEKYSSKEYKQWFKYVEEILGGEEKLFEFWLKNNEELAKDFIKEFIDKYNAMADKKEMDYITQIE